MTDVPAALVCDDCGLKAVTLNLIVDADECGCGNVHTGQLVSTHWHGACAHCAACVTCSGDTAHTLLHMIFGAHIFPN